MQDTFEAPNCSVCMDPLEVDLCSTRCGHVFHRLWCGLDSLLKSLQCKRACPICRGKTKPASVISLTYGLNAISCNRPQIEDLSVPQLQRELSESRRIIGNLKTELEKCREDRLETVQNLAKVTKTSHAAEVKNGELTGRCVFLQTELESLKRYSAGLASHLQVEMTKKAALETQVSALQPYALVAKEVKMLPSYQRAQEIREKFTYKEQADLLFAEVIGLTDLLEQEKKESAHKKTVIDELETQRNKLNARLNIWKRNCTQNANPQKMCDRGLISNSEFETETLLRKVQKTGDGGCVRSRPSLLPPTEVLQNVPSKRVAD